MLPAMALLFTVAQPIPPGRNYVGHWNTSTQPPSRHHSPARCLLLEQDGEKIVLVDFFHVLLSKKTHAVRSAGTGCKPRTFSSPGTPQKCFGVMWPPLGWCLLMSPCPRTATKVSPLGQPQAQQPPTSLSPLVGRGKEVSPAAGTPLRATIPSKAGAERDASEGERGGSSQAASCSRAQWAAGKGGSRQRMQRRQKVSYSSILSGNPQQCCGLVSPWPVWMKLFLSGWLMSWADSPATEVTVFRGNWPTFRVRLF